MPHRLEEGDVVVVGYAMTLDQIDTPLIDQHEYKGTCTVTILSAQGEQEFEQPVGVVYGYLKRP
jgi:hypothetical protein